jgi:hypothetical protein
MGLNTLIYIKNVGGLVPGVFFDSLSQSQIGDEPNQPNAMPPKLAFVDGVLLLSNTHCHLPWVLLA